MSRAQRVKKKSYESMTELRHLLDVKNQQCAMLTTHLRAAEEGSRKLRSEIEGLERTVQMHVESSWEQRLQIMILQAEVGAKQTTIQELTNLLGSASVKERHTHLSAQLREQRRYSESIKSELMRSRTAS